MQWSLKTASIIAEGVNQVTATNDPTAHAEVLAIRLGLPEIGSFELKACDLYTSCEPCPMCLGAIYWTRLDHVYLRQFRGGRVQSRIRRLFHLPRNSSTSRQRGIPMMQIMREEALAAFRAWEAKPNKIPY